MTEDEANRWIWRNFWPPVPEGVRVESFEWIVVNNVPRAINTWTDGVFRTRLKWPEEWGNEFDT